MPYVSSSGKKFHVDGPERLEKRAQPLLLLVAFLFSLWAMVRAGKAAAATLVSPASLKASRSFVPRVDAARAAATAAAIAEAAAAPDSPQAAATSMLAAGSVSMVEDADVPPSDGANSSMPEAGAATAGGVANVTSSTPDPVAGTSAS